MGNQVIFAPSLMCMDLLHACDDLRVLEKYCGMLHADIMDGHFAPNLALSPGFVASIKQETTLLVDAHLMVENPCDYINSLAGAGIDYITVHAEAITSNAFRVINSIRVAGAKAGVALCPGTPLSAVSEYIDLIDLLLVMTVDVGYAGQPFIPQMIGKIKQANGLRAERGRDFLIQVDGCIGKPVYKQLYDSGANVYVMGTSGLFRPGVTLEKSCKQMAADFYSETGVK